MDGKNTLDRILACGQDCFLKYTFKSAPLRKIAAKAGVTTGAFYGYFANKEELFYALTDETAEGLMAILDSVARDMDAFPPGEKVFRMCGVYISRIPEIVDYLLEHRDAMRLIISCSQGTSMKTFLGTYSSAIRAIFPRALQKPGLLSRRFVRCLRIPWSFDGRLLSPYLRDSSWRKPTGKNLSAVLAEVAKVYEAGIWH